MPKRLPSKYDNVLLDKTTKPKEKMTLLATMLHSEKTLTSDFFNFFQSATDSERGTCMSALTIIAKEHPKFLVNHIDFIIEQISAKAPRIKWEASECIAELAPHYPDKVVLAIPRLIKNMGDEGTVARWSTARALTEIAKANPATHLQLLPLFEKTIVKEENNGVRKVYEKAMKSFKKK